MENLKNKTALVTGGSRGIGAAIAKRLAKDGANVVITYQNSADLAEAVVAEISKAGGKALAIQADNNDADALTDAVNQAAEHFGGLDILVSNAGIAFYDDILNFTIADFDKIMSVNVRAVFAASLAGAKLMKKGGRIITIGSCQADRMPTPGGSLYAMSKTALTGLTKGMARDLGPKGITVNLVQPGPVDTDMNPAGGPFSEGQIGLMALDAFGKPEDIAALVAFLSGPESQYITGASLTIDGGTNI